MSKVKEITEEQFLLLSELGMPVMWDIPPYFSLEYIRKGLTIPGADHFSIGLSYLDRKKFVENTKNSYDYTYKFYTLVEDSAERSGDE